MKASGLYVHIYVLCHQPIFTDIQKDNKTNSSQLSKKFNKIIVIRIFIIYFNPIFKM